MSTIIKQTPNTVIWGSLTEAEKAERTDMIKTASDSPLIKMNESLNARLLQARHTLTTLSAEVRRALIAGEPEESLYVQDLSRKISVLIGAISELEVLVGKQTIL